MSAFQCKYKYKVEGLYKCDANVMGRICEELAESEVGLSDETLLDVSRPVEAPLHNEFEWDNEIAGEKYRLSQAAGMIRNLAVVTVKSDGQTVLNRGMVSLPGGNTQYTTLNHAISREDLKDRLLEQARREAKQFIFKYRHLQELAGVVDALETFVNVPVG